MGGCFSKKEEKGDPSSSPRGGRKVEKKEAAGSRDPPPTESPQEEKVKEVLSEITRQNSSNKKKKKESNGGFRDATVDRSHLSDEFSAASTALTETTTAATITAEDDEEGEGEIEMMKKMRPAVTRSRSSAKLEKKTNRSDFSVRESHHRQADGGKREIRGVDVGCRSARSSPSPASVRAREKGNAAAKNRISSSSAAGAGAGAGGGHNNYNNYKREIGERSGRRSLPAAMKRSAAAAVTDKGRCRSSINLSASTATTATRRANGRLSPQRAPPARLAHLEDGRRGQDGKNAAVGGGEDGSVLEAKESLENPLVSMECFIFL